MYLRNYIQVTLFHSQLKFCPSKVEHNKMCSDKEILTYLCITMSHQSEMLRRQIDCTNNCDFNVNNQRHQQQGNLFYIDNTMPVSLAPNQNPMTSNSGSTMNNSIQDTTKSAEIKPTSNRKSNKNYQQNSNMPIL